MFCTKCGTQNDKDNQFCIGCGNDLKEQQIYNSQLNKQNWEYQRDITQYQTNNYVIKQGVARDSLSQNLILNNVKQLGSSPLFLIAIIAFTVNVLFSVLKIVLVMGLSGIKLYGWSKYFDSVDIFDWADGFIAIFFMLVSMQIICIAIGLWITFTSAMDTRVDEMKTSGLTMIKIMNLIKLVGCNISYVVIGISLIISIVDNSLYASEENVSILLVLIVLIMVVAGFTNLYYIKIVQTINTVKKTIRTGVPSSKVSSFVAVVCFGSAFFNIFELFLSGKVIGLLTLVSAIVSDICFGVLLFTYKNKMLTLMCSEK